MPVPAVLLRATLALVGLALGTGVARGHPQYSSATVNRYSKLVLEPSGALRLIYTLMVGDGPALLLRQQADQDRDGRLSAAETDALGQALLAPVRAGLSLTLDGAAVPLRPERPVVGLMGEAVAPAAFSMDLVIRVAARAGVPHEIRYEDAVALTPIGEQEVLVDEGPGVTLLAAQQGAAGAAPRPLARRFLFEGPPPSMLTDRAIHLRYQAPAPPGGAAAGRRWGGLAVLMALLLIIAALLLRRLSIRGYTHTHVSKQ